MKIGFTGTQKGMSPMQIKEIHFLLWDYHPEEVHHGDCIGADEEFHNIAKEIGMSIVIHPPIKDAKRAFCVGDESRPEKDYLTRNQEIVNETDLLVAAPKSNKEELRSGTWATIRYASQKIGRKVIVVWPNGKTGIWREGVKKGN